MVLESEESGNKREDIFDKCENILFYVK